MHIYMSMCLNVCVSISLYLYMPICIYVYVYMSTPLYVYMYLLLLLLLLLLLYDLFVYFKLTIKLKRLHSIPHSPYKNSIKANVTAKKLIKINQKCKRKVRIYTVRNNMYKKSYRKPRFAT